MAQNAWTWRWTNGVWFVAWRMAGWTFIAGEVVVDNQVVVIGDIVVDSEVDIVVDSEVDIVVDSEVDIVVDSEVDTVVDIVVSVVDVGSAKLDIE